VATVEACEAALRELAARLDERGAGEHDRFERTLSCTLRDLGVTFAGQLNGGRLRDIARQPAGSPAAQIRLEMSSDDLVKLVAGELNMASAWAAGRVRVHAGVRDMMRLRSLF